MKIITLTRNSRKRVNQAIARRHLQEILDRGLASGRKKNWEIERGVPTRVEPRESEDGSWDYVIEFHLNWVGRQDEPKLQDFLLNKVKGYMLKAAKSRGGWEIKDYKTDEEMVNVFNGDDIIAEIEIERGAYFDKIYGLDPQIDIVLNVLETAKETDYSKRFHTILYGDPGCGKSEILASVKEMGGEEGVMEFDGTMTTSAGATSKLFDTDILPPVLIIEEIEKVSDTAFFWLLSALDSRSEIKKVINGSTRQRRVPFVCIATVNDLELFETRNKGAMASRFTHKLRCPRPTEEILRQILHREIEEVGGKEEWAEPALRYCIDRENTSDPRRVIAVCLTGRDGLLDGSFQKKMEHCRG